jgi:hypothetical protein
MSPNWDNVNFKNFLKVRHVSHSRDNVKSLFNANRQDQKYLVILLKYASMSPPLEDNVFYEIIKACGPIRVPSTHKIKYFKEGRETSSGGSVTSLRRRPLAFSRGARLFLPQSLGGLVAQIVISGNCPPSLLYKEGTGGVSISLVSALVRRRSPSSSSP